MKHVLTILAMVVLTNIGRAQPAPEMWFSLLNHPAPGYYLLAPHPSESVTLVDHACKNAFEQPAGAYPINMMCTDSTLTYYDNIIGLFVRLNQHFERINTFTIDSAYNLDAHEGHILSNGNYVILGTETRVMDLSATVPGGRPDASVIGSVFQERTFAGVTVFEWRSLDHLNEISILDATEDVDLTARTINYIHVNSVVRDNDGNYLVSCRHTDEVVKISRTNGSVLWRMGGQKSKGNQFTFINDTFNGFVGFSHQHDVQRTANGNILLFDNGNLKPTPFSRAVEYAVNESTHTARVVWSHTPSPLVYTVSMGSVQELSNGNVLIGYGNSASSLAGQEVSRDGTLQMELRKKEAASSYRLRKAVFAMSGTERVVTTPSTVTFTYGDSSTHFSTTLSRVSAPTSIIVERHSYAPHNSAFESDAPCTPMQLRWVVRASDAADVSGAMRFDVGSFGIAVPALLAIYHRPMEGAGNFMQLASTYNSQSKSLDVSEFRTGEFCIAYPMCYDPAPLIPLNNATNVDNDVLLRWSPAVQTGGYDVEVYTGPVSIGPPLFVFRTSRVDTTIPMPISGALYSWRVRALRPGSNSIGPWSTTSTFRTRLIAPVALGPSSLPDSNAVRQGDVFRWTRVLGTAQYRVQVVPFGTSVVALDTVVVDTSFMIGGSLPWNTSMQWSVRGENGGSESMWSNSLFIVTPPSPPVLIFPAAGSEGHPNDDVPFLWSSVEGAKLYHIRIYKDAPQGAISVQDSTSSNQIHVVSLASTSVQYWQVRAIGRYGAGPWSNTQWFMTRGQSVLGIPSPVSPVGSSGVDTLGSSLSWTPVTEATSYRVQLTTKTTFTKPDFEWMSEVATILECPPLVAGKAYRWRVMALNDIANGPWSVPAIFTTLPGADDALEPLTPIPGCIDVPQVGTVTYITSPRFSEYRVEYAVDPLFTSVEQTAAASGAVASYNLQPDQEYWWRVIGLKNDLAVDTGSTANFTTGSMAISSVSDVTETTATVRLSGTTLLMKGAIEGADLQIMDVAGRTVYHRTLPNLTTAGTDLGFLQVGMYIAVISLRDARIAVHSFVLSR